MDSNTYLARVFRASVKQVVCCNGVFWKHEPGGNWEAVGYYSEEDRLAA